MKYTLKMEMEMEMEINQISITSCASITSFCNDNAPTEECK